LEGVLALRHGLFGAQCYWDDRAYLKWRYRFGSNSAGRGECWVLQLDGRVVGMVGTEDIELCRGEQRIAAWSTMDIAIAPAFEGSGLGGWMNLRLCEAAGCAITIGSNEKSRNMISRTFRRLPNRRSYVLPIRFERILAKRLKSPAVARVVSIPLDVAAAAWRFILRCGVSNDVKIRPMTSFGSEVNELVLRAADPQAWQIERSVEFLTWRLLANPRVRYSVLGAYKQDLLVGYLATMQYGARTKALSLVLVDWCVDRTWFAQVFEALCAAALQSATESGADTVGITVYHPQAERVARHLGFIPRFAEFETVAVYATDVEKLHALLAAASWDLTEANTDRDDI